MGSTRAADRRYALVDASAAVRHPEVRFPLGWAGGNY